MIESVTIVRRVEKYKGGLSECSRDGARQRRQAPDIKRWKLCRPGLFCKIIPGQNNQSQKRGADETALPKREMIILPLIILLKSAP